MPPIRSAYRRRAFGALLPEAERIQSALQSQADSIAAKLPGGIIAELENPALVKIRRWVKQLGNCCLTPHIQRSPSTDRCRLVEYRCRSRLCPRCSLMRSRELTWRITELVKTFDTMKLVTLSERSTDEPLEDQVARLRSHWGKLRRTQTWKEAVNGGIVTLEITFNHSTKRWHPHLHAIVDAKYIPHRVLLATWETIVQDHASAHIKAVPSATAAARYISSYVAKSSDVSKLKCPLALVEWAEAVAGQRMAQTFGAAHGVKLDINREVRPGSDITDWVHDSSAADVAAAAEAGDAKARALLDSLLRDSQDAIHEDLIAWRREMWKQRQAAIRESPPPPPPQLVWTW